MSDARHDVEQLAARVDEGVAAARLTLASAPHVDALASLEHGTPRPVLVTGIGGSEGPARFLAALLANHLGLPARFAPLSQFARLDGARDAHRPGASAAPPPTPRPGLVVVFSQGLCPNARLALAGARSLGPATRRLLVTSLDLASCPLDAAGHLCLEVDAGLELCTLPPRGEDGLLVRVAGPLVALAASLAWADRLARRMGLAPLAPDADAAADAMAAARSLAREHPIDLDAAPVALVSAHGHTELCRGLAHLLLEGLLAPEPPTWDALSFAHGPFQQLHGRRAALVALEGPDAMTPELTARLRALLRPGLHDLAVIGATLAGPAALLEHEVALREHVIAALRRCPRDLARWPGKGEDGPLYDLGR